MSWQAYKSSWFRQDNEAKALYFGSSGICIRDCLHLIAVMAWPAHSVNEGGRLGMFGGAALLGIGAVSWYMYYNKTLPEHSGQTSNKASWQQYSGPTHENTDTSKPKGPEQSSKEH